jgi:hypothetical protein
MNREEIILSIKGSLKKLFSTEMKFNEYTLADGSKIICDGDTLDVGVGVRGVDAMGTEFPLDNGAYQLDNGTSINVVDGKVESVMETPEKEDEAEMEQVGKSITPSTDNKVEEMTKKIEMIESQMAETLSLVSEMIKGQEKMNNTFMSQIEEVKNSPAVESIKNDKKGFQGFSKDFTKESKKNEINDLRKIIVERNKNNNNLAI